MIDFIAMVILELSGEVAEEILRSKNVAKPLKYVIATLGFGFASFICIGCLIFSESIVGKVVIGLIEAMIVFGYVMVMYKITVTKFGE